jgi:hypothetical protein
VRERVFNKGRGRKFYALKVRMQFPLVLVNVVRSIEEHWIGRMTRSEIFQYAAEEVIQH